MGNSDTGRENREPPLVGSAASDPWGSASVCSRTAGGVMLVEVEGELDAPALRNWRELLDVAVTGGADRSHCRPSRLPGHRYRLPFHTGGGLRQTERTRRRGYQPGDDPRVAHGTPGRGVCRQGAARVLLRWGSAALAPRSCVDPPPPPPPEHRSPSCGARYCAGDVAGSLVTRPNGCPHRRARFVRGSVTRSSSPGFTAEGSAELARARLAPARDPVPLGGDPALRAPGPPLRGHGRLRLQSGCERDPHAPCSWRSPAPPRRCREPPRRSHAPAPWHPSGQRCHRVGWRFRRAGTWSALEAR